MKVSRNAPCPCGSGKKYKMCCRPGERDATRGRSAAATSAELDDLTERLVAWARRPEWTDRWHEVFTAHTRNALERNSVDLDDLDELFGEDLVATLGAAAFEDLATRTFEEGPENLIDDYIARRGWSESRAAIEHLMALRDSVASVYEVVAVEPGRSVWVRDMLRPGDKIEVRETHGSQDVVRWDLLATRVVPAGDANVFSGANMRYDRDTLRVLQRAFVSVLGRTTWTVEQIIDAMKEQMGTPLLEGLNASEIFGREQALPAACPLISLLWLNALLDECDRPPPSLVSLDGDDIALPEVRFHIDDDAHEAIVDRLEACADLERCPADDAAWHWSRERRRGDPPGDDRVELGHLRLVTRELVLETNSSERCERGKRLVEELLGELRVPGEMSLGGFDFPGEWLDLKLPALRNKTPRKATRTAAGREEVVALLKDLENRELHAARLRGSLPYDFSWMWRELGLERDA